MQLDPSAIAHGISHAVGQVAVGMLADLVLWKPENFGAKPEMVLKSGVIAWSQVRDSPISLVLDGLNFLIRWVTQMRPYHQSNQFMANQCGGPIPLQQLSTRSCSSRRFLSIPGR